MSFVRRFLFASADPLPLAVFRIFLGLLLTLMYLALAPHWDDYFGSNRFFTEYSPYWNVFEGFSFLNFSFFWWLGYGASVLLTLGFQTRTMTVVLFLLQSAMMQTNRMTINGEDLVFRFLLFYSIFATLNGTLSLDSWLRKRKHKSQTVGLIWPVRLMQINTALIYFFSLPAKLKSDPTWFTGDFMYYTLVNSTWSRWPFIELSYIWIISAAMTYCAVLAEGLFPIIVWFKKIRFPAVLMMMGFHIFIAIFLNNVTFFSLAMVAGCMSFLKDEDFRYLYTFLTKFRFKSVRPS